MKGKNKYEIKGEIAKVFFRNADEYFICDADIVHELVDEHTWHKNNRGYAETMINYKHIPAHIFIVGKKDSLEIDHINRNRLDNRRCNLRHVTHYVNTMNKDFEGIYNKHGKTGIRPSNNKKGYLAFIHHKKQTIYLGTFKSLEEAIKARKEAEAFYWGKQARA